MADKNYVEYDSSVLAGSKNATESKSLLMMSRDELLTYLAKRDKQYKQTPRQSPDSRGN